MIGDRRVGRVISFYPPGPCPFLANSTRCSGVKSVNRRFATGGRGIWPGLGRPLSFPPRFSCVAGIIVEAAASACGCPPDGGFDSNRVLKPTTSMLDLRSPCVRQANHNPPTVSSVAIVSNRCFAFMLFCFLNQASRSHSLGLRHCAQISKGWLSIWNEAGEFWCEAAVSGNEPDGPRGG